MCEILTLILASQGPPVADLSAPVMSAPLSIPPGELLRTVMSRGGIVMWPLLLLSLVSLTLIIERAWFWLGMHGPRSIARLERLKTALRGGRRDEAQRLLRGDRTVYAAVAARLLDDGPTDPVVLEAVERQRPRLDRFMATLSTIITAAPMIGILGTVLGIIRSFRLLGMDARLADPLQVSGGIAEALITTAAGLVVALCTLFPYMMFRAQVDRSISRLEILVAAARQGAVTKGDASRPSGDSASR